MKKLLFVLLLLSSNAFAAMNLTARLDTGYLNCYPSQTLHNSGFIPEAHGCIYNNVYSVFYPAVKKTTVNKIDLYYGSGRIYITQPIKFDYYVKGLRKTLLVKPDFYRAGKLTARRSSRGWMTITAPVKVNDPDIYGYSLTNHNTQDSNGNVVPSYLEIKVYFKPGAEVKAKSYYYDCLSGYRVKMSHEVFEHFEHHHHDGLATAQGKGGPIYARSMYRKKK